MKRLLLATTKTDQHPVAVAESASICDYSPTGTPARGSAPPGGLGCGVKGPRHPRVVFWGLARPRHRVSLPAVVTHVRHRGGNSTPLDIRVTDTVGVADRSGPVTKVQRRIGVAVHQLPTRRAHPQPLGQLEARAGA